MIEVSGFPHGQLFAVPVGEFVKFSRGNFRPDGGIKVGERVDQFVGFSNDSNERCSFSDGFHRRDTDGFDCVPCEGDTGSNTVEGCRGTNLAFVVPA